MNETFEAFDLHRIFFGDAPISFLLEIIFRTAIMYTYTIFLLRILGKRGMGQLSTLELAIIIGFGSAVGDPMLHADTPVTHGMVCITVVAFLQMGLEKIINANKKVEKVMEGEPNLVVDNGVMKGENMEKDKLSKEDLFRMLRVKDIEHLGKVNKAFFETTGQLSVMLLTPKHIKPGLSVLPKNEIPAADILKKNTLIYDEANYSCMQCGHTQIMYEEDILASCPVCNESLWIKAME